MNKYLVTLHLPTGKHRKEIDATTAQVAVYRAFDEFNSTKHGYRNGQFVTLSGKGRQANLLLGQSIWVQVIRVPEKIEELADDSTD